VLNGICFAPILSVRQTRQRWIETESSFHVPIVESCSFGRSQGNTIVVASERASRRHALVHLSDEGSSLLVDLGSSNGTYLNGHRVRNLVELSDGDIITIGSRTFVFREEIAGIKPKSDLTAPPAPELTSFDQCWMLVADTEDPTRYASLPEDEADGSMKTVEGWTIQAQRVIAKHGGVVSAHLGEGLLAYWVEKNPAIRIQIVKAVEGLEALSERQRKPFRIALHFGEATPQVHPGTSAQSLGGKGMMQAFQMQKSVWNLPVPIVLSEPAARKLGSLAPLAPVSDFNVQSPEELYTMLLHQTA
jgi:class 3 adenylate cyclase